MNFILHEFVHLLITVLVTAFFWRSWTGQKCLLILTTLAFGFFLDADHLFDFFAYFGSSFDWRDFFNVEKYMPPSGKIYVPLHGWEFIPILWLITQIVGRKIKIAGLEWVVTGAYFGHLFWDQISFPHRDLAYFFLYRLINNFSIGSFNGF